MKTIDQNIQRLPSASFAAATVVTKVGETIAKEMRWLEPVANAVVKMRETRAEIERLWQHSVYAVRTVMTGPANTTRAGNFTTLSEENAFEFKMAFVTQPAVLAKACDIVRLSNAGDPTQRAQRALSLLHGFIYRVGSSCMFCCFSGGGQWTRPVGENCVRISDSFWCYCYCASSGCPIT